LVTGVEGLESVFAFTRFNSVPALIPHKEVTISYNIADPSKNDLKTITCLEANVAMKQTQVPVIIPKNSSLNPITRVVS